MLCVWSVCVLTPPTPDPAPNVPEANQQTASSPMTARGYFASDAAVWFFTCAFVQSQYYRVHSDLIKEAFEGLAVFQLENINPYLLVFCQFVSLFQ